MAGTSLRRWPNRPLVMLVALPVLGIGLMAAGLILRSRPESSGAADFANPLAFRFYSESLQESKPIKVFLPPGYDSGSRRYPVLYMLHGRAPEGDENYEWEVYGIFDVARRLMAGGEIEPFIIVLPQGERSYWVDHADGPPWGRYLAVDVVGEIDRRYRTLAGPGQRAVGGLSMGADGALQIALTYPGVFGVVGVHSPVLKPYELADSFYGDLAYFEAHYPVSLVQARTDLARELTIAMDVGEEDLWLGATEDFHRLLLDLNIDHAWNRWPGPHYGDYWTAHLEDYLRFYASAFASP